MDKFFYFRTVADEDDDDDSAASVMVPVKDITGLNPASTTTLKVFFKSQKNEGVKDSVLLTVTQGRIKDTIAAMVSAINAGPHSDGITIVADDVTTDYDGTTRAATYLSHITACGAITVG